MENRIWRQRSGWVACAEPSTRNTYPGVSHTLSLRFLNQNYPKYTSDVVSKIPEKIKHNYQMFCLNLWSSWNWTSWGESWKSLLPIFLMFSHLVFLKTNLRRFCLGLKIIPYLILFLIYIYFLFCKALLISLCKLALYKLLNFYNFYNYYYYYYYYELDWHWQEAAT